MEAEQKHEKKSVCHRERFEQNQQEMFQYRREKYRTQRNKDSVNIKVCKGTWYFDFLMTFFSCIYNMKCMEQYGRENVLVVIIVTLLDEQGIRLHGLDIMETPHKTMTYLKICCTKVFLTIRSIK